MFGANTFGSVYFGQATADNNSAPTGTVAFAGSLLTTYSNPNFRSAPAGAIAFSGAIASTELRHTLARPGSVVFGGSLVTSYFGVVDYTASVHGSVVFSGLASISSDTFANETEPVGISIATGNPLEAPTWVVI